MLYLCKKIVSLRMLRSASFTLAVTGLILGALLSGCGGSSNVATCGSCSGTTPTTLTLTAPSGLLVKGQSATFTATVTPTAATGTVAITDPDPVLSNTPPLGKGNLQAGTVSIALTPLHAGMRTYDATYSGDSTYAVSAAAAVVSIEVPPTASSCGLGSAAYLVSSGNVSPAQTSFASTAADESAVCTENNGSTLSLTSPLIAKSGAELDGSGYIVYGDDPSGIDAGVLAYGDSSTTASGATITLLGTPSITATGASYAVFASGQGATVNLANATVASTGSTATIGAGNNGQINVDGSTVTADTVPLAVFNGGTVVLQNTALTATSPYGQILLTGPFSGTPFATHFRMIGGSFSTVARADLAYQAPLAVGGSQAADMYFSQVDLSKLAVTPTENLLQYYGAGSLAVTLDKQTMQGYIEANSSSTLTIQNGSSLDGDFIGGGSVTLDASSSWTIHTTFGVKGFSDPGGISGTQILNITGNGQSITYSNVLNPLLGGLTYTLKGSGTLKPD
jgi:hypothetical protein